MTADPCNRSSNSGQARHIVLLLSLLFFNAFVVIIITVIIVVVKQSKLAISVIWQVYRCGRSLCGTKVDFYNDKRLEIDLSIRLLINAIMRYSVPQSNLRNSLKRTSSLSFLFFFFISFKTPCMSCMCSYFEEIQLVLLLLNRGFTDVY